MRSAAQLVTLLLAVTAVAAAQANSPGTPVFPLARGTFWVYEGEVTYNLTPNQVTTATIRRRMDVQEVINGSGFHAALIKGGPWDLAFYSNNKPAGDYLIVSTNDATYFAAAQQALDLFKLLKDGGLTHEVRDTLEENLWFHTPLRAKGQYCPPDQLARADGMYCWVVTDTKSEKIAAAGVKPATRNGFELELRTNPDIQTVALVPGIGMTHYTYSHHGTPSDVDVKLVEFHAGK